MKSSSKPWAWVPSLYFAQGLPYVMVMTVSVIMYKRLEVSNTDIALYTSWLYLPWVIKPLWSPFVDLLKTKRWWIIIMQLMVGAGLAGVAFTIPTEPFFQYTLAFFWLLAFSSATHDIAADGFYMLALEEYEQSVFVGIRSTFYRVAMIAGQGLLVVVAGHFENTTNIRTAWSITFGILAVAFVLFYVYHQFMLPRPAKDLPVRHDSSRDLIKNSWQTILSYFDKPGIWTALAFLLLYRLGEAQLVKLAAPFLLDKADVGGLALETGTVGIIYGTAGLIALSMGGILGGLVIARHGLKYWLFPMAIAMNLPNLVYVYLAHVLPQSIWLISSAVAVEQFGYGFGFTAYVMFMIYFSEGKSKTAHYAISTGFMAMGMMFPGMISGWIQEITGYGNFFIWVVLCTIPGFFIIRHLKIDEAFGVKKQEVGEKGR